jgi:hypothetical protein
LINLEAENRKKLEFALVKEQGSFIYYLSTRTGGDGIWSVESAGFIYLFIIYSQE